MSDELPCFLISLSLTILKGQRWTPMNTPEVYSDKLFQARNESFRFWNTCLQRVLWPLFFFLFFFWYCNELIVRSFADKWQCITGKDVKQAAYKVLSTIVVFYIVTGLVVCSDTAPKYNSKNYRKSQNALSSENPVNKNQVVQWGVWSSAALDGIAGFVLVNLNFSSS